MYIIFYMKKGLLIILSGPSGVGKGTIREYLFKNKSINLVFSISMTTRKPRNGEINGVDYFFVSEEDFIKSINEDKLLEYTKFVNNYYGTPKEYIEKRRNEGKNVLLEIETNGAKQVMNKFKGNGEISIFLAPPSFEELEKRIRGRRTESEEVIQERLKKAKLEMNCEGKYNYVVINDSPELAATKIIEIIKENQGKCTF